VVEDGSGDPRSCWFNTLYARGARAAVEMTAALLDRTVALTGRNCIATASLRSGRTSRRSSICAGGAGNAFARRMFRSDAASDAATTTRLYLAESTPGSFSSRGSPRPADLKV
jgi:hypothetical protein